MPRRPRPASREKPGKEKIVADVASSSKVKLPLPQVSLKRSLNTVDSESESGREEWGDDDDGGDEVSSSDSDEEKSSDDGSLGEPDEDGVESDVDVDAPRVAQWVDEEDLEQLEGPSDDVPHQTADDIVRLFLVSTQ